MIIAERNNATGVKEYLLQIKRINCLIELKQKEIESLHRALDVKAVSYDDVKVQRGGATDRTDLICKIIDYEREIVRSIDNLIDLKKRISEELNKLDNEELIKLLYLRYFEFKSWEEIAIDMGYSYRWILRLHGKALLEFDKIIQNK